MSGPASNQESNSQCTPMPFEPSCDFEREVYQQWLAGQPWSREIVTLECQEYDFRNGHDQCPANATINRVDSGIDVCDDQFTQAQEGSQPEQQPGSQNHYNTELDQEQCPSPETCELSPEMSSTMRRFEVKHTCVYAEAKKQLVDKIVHRVMENAAPRIMALLEEELQRRAAEKNGEDYEDSRRTRNREGDFVPRL